MEENKRNQNSHLFFFMSVAYKTATKFTLSPEGPVTISELHLRLFIIILEK